LKTSLINENVVSFWSQIFFYLFFPAILSPCAGFNGWIRTNDPRMARQVVYHYATPAVQVSFIDKIMKLYDNKYSLIIDIYFYETFSTQTSSACTLKHFLDTLSNILDKCLHFSLIKIESVSINPSQAMLGTLFSSVVYTFRLKMLSLVLIKNRNSFVYLIWILSNKLDLNQDTHFTIKWTKLTKKFINFQFRRFLVTQLLNLPHSLFFLILDLGGVL
jgi:hypothetical protein